MTTLQNKRLDSHQGALQSKDGRRPRLLQRLHAAPPPAPPEAVRLAGLQVKPPAEQRGVLPALPLRLVRTLLGGRRKKEKFQNKSVFVTVNSNTVSEVKVMCEEEQAEVRSLICTATAPSSGQRRELQLLTLYQFISMFSCSLSASLHWAVRQGISRFNNKNMKMK